MNASDSFIPAIPLDWLSQAAKLPGKSINIALALWWLRSIAGGGSVKLTKKSLELFSVNREVAGDCLNRLEQEGLITVNRRRGMKHSITILPPEPIQPRVQVEKIELPVLREELPKVPSGPRTLRGVHNLPPSTPKAPPQRGMRAQLIS
jgi:hypothetical protein